MAVGKMGYDDISSAPGMDQLWVQILFWIIHLMGFYATASAAISTLGAEPLRKLRLFIARWGDLNLIYGLSDESIELGKELLSRKGSSVVFVDRNPDASHNTAVAKLGCVLRSDTSAVNADEKFLKSIGIHGGKRKINVYVLSKDTVDGFRFAHSFLNSMQQCGVAPEQTSLVIHGNEDIKTSSLQVCGDCYGFGFVTVFQNAGLAARVLIQKFPPCNHISFDAEGRACENFESVIIGFGRVGQAVLRNLVMNGQFEGSHFRSAVFAKDCDTASGYFMSNSEQLLQNYDISFYPYDGRDRRLIEYLRQRGGNTKYIVVCTGSEQVNHEIAEDLTMFYERFGLTIPIYLCSYRGVKCYDADIQKCKLHRLYQLSVLSSTTLDRMAMILNHYYQGANGTTPLGDWMKCDYFSRMSCRASADYLSAMLRAAGKTEEQVMNGEWSFSDVHLENLSKMEHRRWCAFHHVMGFSAMSAEEFDQRGQEYLRQKAECGKATIRIAKNMAGRTHACLVEWDALDELSEKEQRYTGKYVNYKAMDTDNVVAIPKLLQARKDSNA